MYRNFYPWMYYSPYNYPYYPPMYNDPRLSVRAARPATPSDSEYSSGSDLGEEEFMIPLDADGIRQVLVGQQAALDATGRQVTITNRGPDPVNVSLLYDNVLIDRFDQFSFNGLGVGQTTALLARSAPEGAPVTIQFSSPNPMAQLPPDYTFIPANLGGVPLHVARQFNLLVNNATGQQLAP